ncbi:hypothetical protein GE21DRAFT_1100507 [Neurospora crassa]|nr:hypothetical protein GE21DRAFT_1100507 [Neurospora crassa]
MSSTPGLKGLSDVGSPWPVLAFFPTSPSCPTFGSFLVVLLVLLEGSLDLLFGSGLGNPRWNSRFQGVVPAPVNIPPPGDGERQAPLTMKI